MTLEDIRNKTVTITYEQEFKVGDNLDDETLCAIIQYCEDESLDIIKEFITVFKDTVWDFIDTKLFDVKVK